MIPHALVDAWTMGSSHTTNAEIRDLDGSTSGVARFSAPDVLSLGIAMSVEHRAYEIWATHWGKWGDLPMFARHEQLHLYAYNERHNPKMSNPYETIAFLTGR